MKTSNKLLIGLIGTLMLVPLIYTLIDSKYKRVDSEVYYRQIEQESASLDEKDVYMETVPLTKFDKVIIKGGEYMLNIRIVESDRHALKISKKDASEFGEPKLEEEVLTLERDYDNSGVLSTADITLFAPSLSNIELQNVGINSFIADMDSVNLRLTSMYMLNFTEQFHVRNLSLFIDKSNMSFRYDPLAHNTKSLSLHLKESVIKLYCKNDCQQMDISLEGANLLLKGEGKSDDEIKIDTFAVKTSGQSKIDVESINLDKVSGSISPETQTNLPPLILNQMLYLQE